MCFPPPQDSVSIFDPTSQRRISKISMYSSFSFLEQDLVFLLPFYFCACYQGGFQLIVHPESVVDISVFFTINRMFSLSSRSSKLYIDRVIKKTSPSVLCSVQRWRLTNRKQSSACWEISSFSSSFFCFENINSGFHVRRAMMMPDWNRCKWTIIITCPAAVPSKWMSSLNMRPPLSCQKHLRAVRTTPHELEEHYVLYKCVTLFEIIFLTCNGRWREVCNMSKVFFFSKGKFGDKCKQLEVKKERNRKIFLSSAKINRHLQLSFGLTSV